MYSILLLAAGAIGGILTYCFGDAHNGALITLLVFMGVDFVTGIIVAICKKSEKTSTGGLDSGVGWKGLARKGITILVCLVAHRLDVALEIECIMNACISAFILNELLSIVENCGLMGIPLPSFITKAIEVLKNKSDADAEKAADEVTDKTKK